MDKRSYKKVVLYIMTWFIVICALTLGTVMILHTETKQNHAQLAEMIVMHPEQELELKDSFDYYGTKMKQNLLRFWLFLVTISTLSFCLFYIILRKKEFIQNRKTATDLNLLYEQLVQYKKGDFQIEKSFSTQDEFCENAEEWLRIKTSLQELGYYFNSLRERLFKEENSTKALISDISHQLKTPLSSLRLSHELAQETKLTDEERQEFIKQEEQEIHKLEFLLEELVNMSRLENHMIQIKPEQSGIKKTLTEAVNQVFMKAYSKNIIIQVDIAEDINVYHDPKWTVEAFSNVLDNAIKYSEAGSCISICTHKLPNLLLIEIEDEGIGIATEELHKIFQRFYRGKIASSMVKDGAGIGLYLTRRILEEQGGTIVAKRKQQNGTIFRITLPIKL